jgi:hypothetical protein
MGRSSNEPERKTEAWFIEVNSAAHWFGVSTVVYDAGPLPALNMIRPALLFVRVLLLVKLHFKVRQIGSDQCFVHIKRFRPRWPTTTPSCESFSITPALCPDELQQPLVLNPFGDLTHQFVVIDPIEGKHRRLPTSGTIRGV